MRIPFKQAFAAVATGGSLVLVGGALMGGTDQPCPLNYVGLDIFPFVTQNNQPSTVGDFRGRVGYASLSATGGPGDNWTHMEVDARYMEGTAKDLCGVERPVRVGLT